MLTQAEMLVVFMRPQKIRDGLLKKRQLNELRVSYAQVGLKVPQ